MLEMQGKWHCNICIRVLPCCVLITLQSNGSKLSAMIISDAAYNKKVAEPPKLPQGLPKLIDFRA